MSSTPNCRAVRPTRIAAPRSHSQRENQTMATSVATAEGWTERGPTVNQRRAPSLSEPMWGTSTRTSTTSVATPSGRDQRAQRW